MSLISEIHHRALALAGEFKRVEADLVATIQQVDRLKVFREYEFTSTFDYVVKALGLSESNAYALIGVSRKAEEIPEIRAALIEGKVSVSKLAKVLAVITPENQAEWLAKAEKLPRNKLEQEVARANPTALGQERIRQLTEEVRELRIPIDQELFEMLERVKNLRKTQSAQAALKATLGFYLEKNDPLRKPAPKQASVPETLPGKSSTGTNSAIPAATRREVLKRDRAQCTHIGARGERCKNTRYIEVHHLKPRAQGGTHEPDNLRVLCSEHHAALHEVL